MVGFRGPLVVWQFQTTNRFPAVEQGLILEKKMKKKYTSDWALCQKAIGSIYFSKKQRAETLLPGFEFDN